MKIICIKIVCISLTIYIAIPILFFWVVSFVGSIEALFPNRLTKKILEYIESKSDTIENIVDKFYPFWSSH